MWKCQACQEDSEDNFDVCWQCGLDRNGLAPVEEPPPTPNATICAADGRAFAADGTKPLASLLERVDVQASATTLSRRLVRLESGTVVELQTIWKINGGWTEIRLADGSKGYIPEETKATLVQRVKLKAKSVGLFAEPSATGAPLRMLTRGNVFWSFPDRTAASSLRVWLDLGEQGYIPTSAKVAALPPVKIPTEHTAAHDVIAGALWLMAGIVVTVGSYSMVSESGGTYLIWWGPVVFGGIQFMRGLYGSVTTVKAPVYGPDGDSPDSNENFLLMGASRTGQFRALDVGGVDGGEDPEGAIAVDDAAPADAEEMRETYLRRPGGERSRYQDDGVSIEAEPRRPRWFRLICWVFALVVALPAALAIVAFIIALIMALCGWMK